MNKGKTGINTNYKTEYVFFKKQDLLGAIAKIPEDSCVIFDEMEALQNRYDEYRRNSSKIIQGLLKELSELKANRTLQSNKIQVEK